MSRLLTVLEIRGKSDDTTLWVDLDGDTFPATAREIAFASREAEEHDVAEIKGRKFDWSQCILLAHAIRHGAFLDSCRCGEPAPFSHEGGWVCELCLRGFGFAEDASEGER